MNIKWLLILGGLLISNLAQAQQTYASVFTQELTPGELSQIKIEGVWSNGCVPDALELNYTQGILMLVAQQVQGICTAALTPFELTFDWNVPSDVQNPVPVYFQVFTPAYFDAQTYAFSVLQLADDELQYPPESGLWWSEQAVDFDSGGPGTGYALDWQNNTLALTAYVYNLDQEPVWYLAAGKMNGRVFESDLLAFTGGQAPLSAYQAPTDVLSVGKVYLAFSQASRAILWYAIPETAGAGLHVQSYALTRQIFGVDAVEKAFLGTWMRGQFNENQSQSAEIIVLESVEVLADGQFSYKNESGETVLLCQSVEQITSALFISCQEQSLISEDNMTLNVSGLQALDYVSDEHSVHWRRINRPLTTLPE